MPYGVINADKQVDSLNNVFAPASSVMKNRIINGNMVLDQRNSGASVTPASGAYTLDRWALFITQASKMSVQQNAGSITPPAGFTNYLGATTVSAYSVTASDYFMLNQAIEGFNVADLGWGTANAKTVTLSFQVYSSLTGTFGGALNNNAGNRSYPFTYSIAVANTWTTISVTIPGDTSGTWTTNNTAGIWLRLGLGVGSTYSGTAGSWSGSTYYSATGAVSVVGTSSATFYITGVQLEVGLNATNFEYRQYQQEYMLCLRYHQGTASTAASLDGNYTYNLRAISFLSGCTITTSNANRVQLPLLAPMRAVPTVTTSDNNGNLGKAYFNGANGSSSVFSSSQNYVVQLINSVGSGNYADMYINYNLDAEL